MKPRKRGERPPKEQESCSTNAAPHIQRGGVGCGGDDHDAHADGGAANVLVVLAAATEGSTAAAVFQPPPIHNLPPTLVPAFPAANPRRLIGATAAGPRRGGVHYHRPRCPATSPPQNPPPFPSKRPPLLLTRAVSPPACPKPAHVMDGTRECRWATAPRCHEGLMTVRQAARTDGARDAVSLAKPLGWLHRWMSSQRRALLRRDIG